MHLKTGIIPIILTLKAPNTTLSVFANTADPDETAHNGPSHLDLIMSRLIWIYSVAFWSLNFQQGID